MSQYLVSTPDNPQYNGKTYGVLFRAGRAFVSEHTIDPALGWSVDEVVRKMHDDFGYVVERVADRLPVIDTVLSAYQPPAEGVDVPDLVEAETAVKKRSKASADKALEA